MEFIADWQTINNPNALTHASIALAVAVTIAFAVPVYRTAKKVHRVKPQSFMLLMLPAMLIFGGTQLDDVRADRHVQNLTASGATSDSWNELAALIETNYRVSNVEPVGDVTETLDAVKAAASGSTNVSNLTDPKVSVQHPDSTHRAIYRVVVTPIEGGNPVVSLARQQSMEITGEGVDPEAFRVQ